MITSHVDYPHNPGYLPGCPACDALCAYPGDQEHDHEMCVDAVAERDDDPDDHDFDCTCFLCIPGA